MCGLSLVLIWKGLISAGGHRQNNNGIQIYGSWAIHASPFCGHTAIRRPDPQIKCSYTEQHWKTELITPKNLLREGLHYVQKSIFLYHIHKTFWPLYCIQSPTLTQQLVWSKAKDNWNSCRNLSILLETEEKKFKDSGESWQLGPWIFLISGFNFHVAGFCDCA